MQALPLHGPFCGLVGAGIGAAACAAYKVLVVSCTSSQARSSTAIGSGGDDDSDNHDDNNSTVIFGRRTVSLSVTRSQILLVQNRTSKSSGYCHNFRAQRRAAHSNSRSDRD